jgi:K+-transporting ATPase ATPase C chain
MLLVLTVLLGLAYPLVLTGLAQAVYPSGADGSLVRRDGRVIGSELVGQSFVDQPQYFQSRPSAAGEGYDPLASSASNLGPENPDLLTAVQERRTAAAELNGTEPAEVAPDALLASGSGLDPHISPAYAAQQVDRVARERGLQAPDVARLVDEYTQGRTLGFLGEPRVNVLLLNLALDDLGGPTASQAD